MACTKNGQLLNNGSADAQLGRMRRSRMSGAGSSLPRIVAISATGQPLGPPVVAARHILCSAKPRGQAHRYGRPANVFVNGGIPGSVTRHGVMQNGSIGVIVCGRDGRIRSASAEVRELLGGDEPSVDGRLAEAFAELPDFAPWSRLALRRLEEGSVGESTLIANGPGSPLRFYATLLAASGGARENPRLPSPPPKTHSPASPSRK